MKLSQGKEIMCVEPQEHGLSVCVFDENCLEVRQMKLHFRPKGKVNTYPRTEGTENRLGLVY